VRAVVQRVTAARVRVGDRVTGEIGPGLLVLLGVGRGDTSADAAYVAAKIRDMRVFPSTALGTGAPGPLASGTSTPVDPGEPAGKPMDRSVIDAGGSVLVVSQFTLYGDVRRGRRPSFDDAAAPDEARRLYEEVVRELRAAPVPVATGEFQAMMLVELVNDGPVTILIDSRRHF